MLPAIAGKIRLMSQMHTVAKPIPKTFVVNIPITVVNIFPLCANSTMAMAGMIAMTKNETLTPQNASNHERFTFNNLNTR